MARCLFFLAWLPLSQGSWQLGLKGDSCDTTCTNLGKHCSFLGQRQLVSNHEFTYVFGLLVADGQIPGNYSQCTDYKSFEAGFAAQPATNFEYYEENGIFYAIQDPTCYQYSDESTCAGTFSFYQRFCCCMDNAGDNPSTACFVPTTTTSTMTSTATSTSGTSSTTGTSVTTTVTTETTQTQTSTSETQTTSSTTVTTTSSTGTTVTTSSSTQTVVTTTQTLFTTTTVVTQTSSTQTSRTETSTSTLVTATSTSQTTTRTDTTSTRTDTSTTTLVTVTQTSMTSTSTTVSQTTSTTTVTRAASTLVSEVVPAGSSVIPVSDRTGFSEDDMIIVRREVVRIDNITLVNRRLEAEDDVDDLDEGRQLSSTVAYFEVVPALTQTYTPGDPIQNLGPAATYTGSDPITFHGGQKIKFWLPNHEEFLLLETHELKIFGEVFPGPKEGLQWFGRIRVVLADDTPVLEARVKPAGNQTRGLRCASNRMESMDIFLGRSGTPLRELQRRPAEFTAGDEVRFAIDCRRQDRPLLVSARTEYIHFETASIAFLLVAAHAGNEFPDDPRMQLKYQHLDLLILEMPRKHEFRGVLPEIWGIRPRSEAVEAMLLPPEPRLAPRACQDRLESAVCPS